MGTGGLTTHLPGMRCGWQPLSGPELLSSVIGETEAGLRRVFDEAKARAPSLVLMDEAEALCRKREGGEGERR